MGFLLEFFEDKPINLVYALAGTIRVRSRPDRILMSDGRFISARRYNMIVLWA